MSWTDDTGPIPNLSENEMLALVRKKADAATGRRRWQVGVAAGAMLIAGLLATVVVRSGPGPGTELRTVSGGLAPSTSTSVATSPTTITDSIVTVPDSTTTTMAGAPPVPSTRAATIPPRAAAPATTSLAVPTTSEPPASPPATTTTSLACRNSFDPACGPRYWDPPPGPNQPMTVAVIVLPASPKAGATVTFRVTVDDPDGSRLLSRSDGTVDFGDGTPITGVGGHADCAGGSGAWTTPAPVPVHEEITYQHTYAAAGTYTARFMYRSLGNCAYGPSDAVKTATVTVTPAG